MRFFQGHRRNAQMSLIGTPPPGVTVASMSQEVGSPDHTDGFDVTITSRSRPLNVLAKHS